MNPLLRITGAQRHFGGVKAVDGVDLTVDQGEILGLIGPNGAGKTTMVNLITGHVKPEAGTIALDGRDLTGQPVHAIARRGVARTFQHLRLYRDLSALDNVIVGMHAHRRSDVLATLAPIGPGRAMRARRREAARDLMERVGLDPGAIGGRAASTLPYGDQRRLEVARALALEPRLLLLDEPAAGLNPVEKNRFAALLRSLGLTIVLIEHDLHLVMDVCNRVAVMDFGRKIADGAPPDVQADPAVISAYVGRETGRTPAAAPVRASGTGRPSGTGPPSGAGTAVLEVAGLQVSYGAVEAVIDASLHVDQGQVVTLIGANGAGKTTILRTLSGLVRARSGDLRFADLDLRHASPGRIVAHGLVHVPEGREILARLTVQENLELGGWRRRDKQQVARDIGSQLERFPVLGSRRDLAAGQLSGGEQQMLAIARALLARPRVLLLDEPSLGLAPQVTDEVFDLIASLAGDGMTILLVEQNAMRALQLADWGYVLETGRIVMSGPAQELLVDPKVQASYLGT